MAAKRKLSASLEDYLEAIFQISAQKRAARAKDIAARLEVNSSSVTGALRNLAEKGLVNYAPYDLITLTDKGEKVARDIVRRHDALQDFFLHVLRVEKDDAEAAACRLEHAISRTVLERLIQFVDFVKTCPRVGDDWLKQLPCVWANTAEERDCGACIEDCLNDYRKRAATLGEDRGDGVRLSELEPGERGRILDVVENGYVHRRLADREIEPGAIVELMGVAKPNGPFEIRAKGYRLSFRKEDVDQIKVARL